jgi:hypothetical protein
LSEGIYYNFTLLFLCLPKRKRSKKKRQPITCSANSGILCPAYKKRVASKVAQLSRSVFPFFISLLDYVEMALYKKMTSIYKNKY